MPDQRDQHEVGDRGHRVGVAPRPSRRRRGRGSRTPAHAAPAPTASGCAASSSSRTSAIGTGVPCQSADPHRSITTSGAPLTVMKCGVVQDAAGERVGTIVERRHELVLGIERHLRAPRELGAGLLRADPHLRSQHHERRFRRVADDRSVVADGRIARQHEAETQTREVGHRSPADAEDRTGLRVAAALDVEPSAVGEHPRRSHRVHGQRAGLVAVDDRGAAEGFDVGERLHDGLVISQMACSRREHRLHERRQTNGDRGDRSRDAQQDERLGVLPTSDAHDRDDRDGGPRQQPEDLGHAVELTLQR